MSRLERVRELLDGALRRPPGSRREYVRRECGDRPSVEAEVASLLRAHERAEQFLSRPGAELLVPPRLAPGSIVGAFEVRRILGVGGFATVYEAIQDRPHRRVALKILHDAHESVDEAEVLGRMRHPGIAHVYGAGAHEGRPYLAMEFVEEARSLRRYVDEVRPRAADRLDLIVAVADAVQYAHMKGIVHRDLKPGNILVAPDGRPKVIDFGLARVGEGDSRAMAGTPAYMSPEQCTDGVDVDARSDVYALGAILCELVGGEVPHSVDGVPLTEALRRIREEPPAIPLRGDLGAIARRALAKDPAERYPSAAALGADIHRARTHRPVEARAGGALYHLSRFARRHQLACAALVTILTVSVVAAVVNGRLSVERDHARRRAEFQTYVASIAAAAAALNGNDVNSAREHLDRAPAEHRGWEWDHLRASIAEPAGRLDVPMYAAAAGTRLMAASLIGEPEPTVRVWDADRRERHEFTCPVAVISIAFAPEDAALFVGRIDGVVESRDPGTGELRRTWRAHDDHVIVLKPGPGVVASGGRDGFACVWDAATGTPRARLPHGERVIGLALDGDRLVAGIRDGTIAVWNWRARERLAVLRGHGDSVEAVAIDHDLLASASRDRTLRLWSIPSGEALAVFRGHGDNVRDVAFAPDGRRFATASYDRSVRVWGRSGQTAVLLGHTRSVNVVAWRGERLLSFGEDGMREWDVDSPRARAVLRGHADHVRRVAVDPGGRWIASLSQDGSVCVWDARTRHLQATLAAGESRAVDLAATPRGIALADAGGPVRVVALGGEVRRRLPRASVLASDGDVLYGAGPGLWRAGRDAPAEELSTERFPALACLAARAGAVALAGRDGRLLLRGRSTAEVRLGSVQALAFDAAGRHLAAGLADGRLLLLDAAELSVVRRLEGHPDFVRGVAFSSDGRRLASCGGRGLSIWMPERGVRLLRVELPTDSTRCLAWTPTALVSAGGVWDVPGEVHVWTTTR